MRIRGRTLTSALVLSWAATAAAAAAQTAPTATPSSPLPPTVPAAPPLQPAAGAPPAGAAPAAASLGEIVVTARRREESLQRVPEAITAFSQNTLTQKAIYNSTDLNKAVPGLAVQSNSANNTLPNFSVRGRGQVYGASAGSVETYFADVPLSSPFGVPQLPPQFFDLQSVQVLKGPQGTLFGRNSTGGAILFVPQAPTNTFGGYARVQGGDYGDFQFEGALNIPLVEDKALLRLATYHWSRDGYGRTTGGNPDIVTGQILPSQTYDNQDVTEERVTLLLRPIDGLQNTTIFAYHMDDDRSTPKAAILRQGSVLGDTIAALYPNILNLGPHVADIDTNLDRKYSSDYAIINTTTYNLTDGLLAKNIFGYVQARGPGNWPNDTDGTPLPVTDQVTTHFISNYQYTDEFQLQGHAFGDRLDYIVGGLLDVSREPALGPGGNIITDTFTGTSFDTLFSRQEDTSESLFSSLTYKITDRLNFSLGYRHTWDDVEQQTNEVFLPTSTQTYPTDQAPETSRHVFEGNTYNAGLEYRVTNDEMVYGGYRHGYKRGGFNAKPPSEAQALFGAETDDDFYVGNKLDFRLLGMRGRFNIEGFYDLYYGAQRSYLTIVGDSLATVTQNAPLTVYPGFDTDFAVDVTPWLLISGSYTYINAYYGHWPDNTLPGETGDQSVNPVSGTSNNKVSLSARFHKELPNNLGELAFAPTINAQDRSYTLDQATRLPNGAAALFGQFNQSLQGGMVIPGYATADLRFEWNHVWNSNVDLAANVTNITNKTFITGTTGILEIGVESDSYGPPRMFNFEARYHF